MSKVYPSATAALEGLLHDGMTLAAGGFGLCDLCVFEVKAGGGLVLTELHPGSTIEDVRAKTGAPFTVASGVGK